MKTIEEHLVPSNKQGHRLGLVTGDGMKAEQMVAASISRMLRGGSKGIPKMSDILKVSTAAQIAGDFNNENGGCALGIIGLEANAVKDGKMNYNKLVEYYKVVTAEMNESAGECPEGCGGDRYTIWGMIPHLNDIHNKSFAEVGVWLETKGL